MTVSRLYYAIVIKKLIYTFFIYYVDNSNLHSFARCLINRCSSYKRTFSRHETTMMMRNGE
ncbi:hypothetical protein BLOT_005086 [Blomia tropicalis]|nr:hypothetical protein BLOT_005086 [Blomia tropicalis]